MSRVSSLLLCVALFLSIGETALAQDPSVAAAVATEGAGPLGLGALVGAIVAAGFALRERFKGE